MNLSFDEEETCDALANEQAAAAALAAVPAKNDVASASVAFAASVAGSATSAVLVVSYAGSEALWNLIASY